MITREDIFFITKEIKKLQISFEKGDFEKVIKKAKILLKKYSTQPILYNLVGLSYKQLDNLELQKRHLNQD